MAKKKKAEKPLAMTREELLELELLGSKWKGSQQETILRTKDLENVKLRIQAMHGTVEKKTAALNGQKETEGKAKESYNKFNEGLAEKYGIEPGFGYDDTTGAIYTP